MTTPANNPGTSSVAQAWTDGITLDDLNEAIRLNAPSTAQQSTNSQRFWSSPARTADSTVQEVLQIDLATERLINKLSFDVATFPHDLFVEYYDTDTKTWGPALDGTVGGTMPLQHTVHNSVPAVLPPISSVTGHLHPQHSFSGHWQPVSFTMRPVVTRSLRLVLSRTTLGTAPVSTLGVPVAYSLGVRNLYLGYEVSDLGDVPYTLPTPDSNSRADFAQTTDMFGSVVSFSVRVNSASNAIRENADSQNALTTVWKSQPQPIPWAVVNFYLDARDTSGEGQVLDRIYLEPLYEGPTTNLYYSNDEPTSAFPAPSDPLPVTVAVMNNSSGVAGNVLHSGLTGLDAIAFIDVNNQAVAFDASRNWWLGGSLHWKFNHGTQTDNNPIFDCGEFNLSMTPFGLRVATAYGDTLNITMAPFDAATGMDFVVSYDGSEIMLSARAGLVDYSASMPVTVPLRSGSTILRVGGFLGTDPGVSDFDLDAFVLKIDTVPDADTINDFFNGSDPYVTASTFMGANDPRTDNALLRYSPTFITADWPTGFVGGTPDRYADLVWTPVARDFLLRKGFMYFNPTRAKYWKLEFTNLSPQFYEVYQPVTRTVEVFPANMWDTSLKVAMTGNVQEQLYPGLSNSYVVNASTSSLDMGATSVSSTGLSGATLPTQARVLTDLTAQTRLGGTYWAWNFLPLHSTGSPPSFQAQGKHVYEIVNYQQSNKLAYFVGLRTVTAYRLDYLVTDDTAQIIEMFNDLVNVDLDTNWILDQDHRLTTGAATYAEVRSKPINTNRIVTGVQFAAQQTDPVKVIPIDTFVDPTLVAWEKVGDAVMTPITSTNLTLGKTARIDRSLPPLTWDDVQGAYSSWGVFDLQGLTWDSVQRGSRLPSEDGGVQSKAATVPYGGRVYAAARITAPADLTSPLYVQLYDDATGIIVAENAVDVTANKITEWYCGYTVGDESTHAVPWRWEDFAPVPSDLPMNDSFVRANSTLLGTMDSGDQWTPLLDNSGNPLSLAISSNKAVVTAEGQEDYTNTGTIWGTVEFTVGTMGSSATAEVRLVQIGPVFLDDTGTLRSLSGSTFSGTRGNVLTTNQSARAVQAGDDIRVDIIPTIMVPAGKADVSLGAGVDPAYVPYSLMFYLNGTWVRTFSHNLGATSRMSIKGRLNQQFTSWKWTPASYGLPIGDAIVGMPRLGNGAWSDTLQSQWLDANNRYWWVPSGTWDTTSAGGTTGRDDTGKPLTASTTGSVFLTDTGAWHGALSVYLANIAGTTGSSGSAGWHGNVLCLDYDNGIFLDYLGRVVQNGTVMGTLFPSGLQTSATITVQFIHTQSMAKANWPSGITDAVTGPNVLSNPSFETDVSSWTPHGGTVAQSTLHPHAGTHSALMTPDGTSAQCYLESNDVAQVTIGAGDRLNVSAWVWLTNAVTNNFSVSVNWFDANGIYLTTSANYVSVAAATLTQVTNTFTAPAGAARATIVPSLAGTPAAGQLWYLDDLSFTVTHNTGTPNITDFLVGSINGTVQGYLTIPAVATWNGTKRGLAGDLWNNNGGSRPGGANYTLDTSFQSFNWAPDATYVATQSANPSWDNVTQFSGVTYDDLNLGRSIAAPSLRARVVQKGVSSDIFEVAKLSMYADPIMWFFSNDGGYTWIPALDIRNNPDGVVLFPQGVSAVDLNQKPGTSLVWRCVAYKPNVSISALTIRPWYGGLLSGITHRPGLVPTGPNVNSFDHYNDIYKDARFQTWNLPIPRDWWYQFEMIARSQAGAAGPTTAVVAPDQILLTQTLITDPGA